MNLGLLLTGVMLLNSQLFSTTSPSFSCDFDKGEWDPSDWTMVKSARWNFYQNQWIQNKDSIENPTPETPIEKWTTSRGDESYISMVTKKRFKGNITIKSTLWFDPKMAPGIVLADELGKSSGGIPEYRNHTEIIFFNEGVNVWVHTYDEKTRSVSFVLTAFFKFTLRSNTRYEIQVIRENKTLTIKVAGQTMGVYLPDLPEEVRVGVSASEGHDRFYNFSVTK
jgi:hypothetical protein